MNTSSESLPMITSSESLPMITLSEPLTRIIRAVEDGLGGDKTKKRKMILRLKEENELNMSRTSSRDQSILGIRFKDAIFMEK